MGRGRRACHTTVGAATADTARYNKKSHRMKNSQQLMQSSTPHRYGIGRVSLILLLCFAVAGTGVSIDWYRTLPDTAVAQYVGRQRCIDCHQNQTEQWTGSHHDLAMDVATDSTVLGDFNDASLTHHGVTSTMYRDGDRFMVRTEGHDGDLHDFHVKYVFGVTPLQQYMVETERPKGPKPGEVGRVQVLRITWDANRNEWYYLSPPDVHEKLAPDDPLHWTGWAQNWNHMCADCHSTNVQKNFDVDSLSYHTTFSEIDVSCEACHGPGSLHVELAERRSLFWDRKRGYALARLKSTDTHVEIETCARCHSRRHAAHPYNPPGDTYYDSFVNEFLQPEIYYPDGQIKDEVYVYGSFIQSKMYHNGVRCTDCHNPHTARLKREGNALCTSCHAHHPAVYDTPAHHGHEPNSIGAQCVECHMPASPFMKVDPRRDHGFIIPRPDRSLELGTPNACAGCHVEPKNVDSAVRDKLAHYVDWLHLGREGDASVLAELKRVNQWSVEQISQWPKNQKPALRGGPGIDSASLLARAWNNDNTVAAELAELPLNRRVSGMVRASALSRLPQLDLGLSLRVSQQATTDTDPQVRVAAVRNLIGSPVRQRLAAVTPLLQDPARTVRMEAARVLAYLPDASLTKEQHQQFQQALLEYRRGASLHGDQAASHMALGEIADACRDLRAAAEHYRAAMRVQPLVTGPRTNLADVLDRLELREEADRYRRQELPLLQRDADLAPSVAGVQYRLGLAYYNQGLEELAEQYLRRACELDPGVPDFRLMLTLFHQKQGRWDESLEGVELLRRLRPNDASFKRLQAEIQQQAAQSRLR